MNGENKPLLTFPCDFPIKIIGHSHPDFQQTLIALVQKHLPDFNAETLTTRLSENDKYTAFNIVVHVESQAQLDDIYRTLSSSKNILMVL